jgi:hypothetical protein
MTDQKKNIIGHGVLVIILLIIALVLYLGGKL